MTDKEASNLVESAISQALESVEDHEEGDILVEWVVIAYVSNPDEGGTNGYPMLFSNGEIPTYRARGLLTTALMKLQDI